MTALEPSIAYLCREALGIADALCEATNAYLLAREQFGRTLASNQALRHRVADMMIRLESFRSLVQASSRAPAGSVDALRYTHAAKAFVGRSALWIARQAIQLHGGMGVSEEVIVGHYFRRLLVIDATLGNSTAHLRAFAKISPA